MRVSATVSEITVPEYTECPYTLVVAVPMPQTDTVTSVGRAPIAISVLNNDNVPAGQTYSIVSFTEPLGGTVIQEGGNLLYTPFSTFDGEDSFSYTVSNSYGSEGTATVNITVIPVYYRYASSSYPIDPVDNLTSGLQILTVTSVLSPRPLDSITSGLDILSGTNPLIVRYLSHANPPEDLLTSSLTILSGTNPLIVRYLTANYGDSNKDSVTSGLTVLGGTYPLTIRYLNNAIQPDHITSGLTILGGT